MATNQDSSAELAAAVQWWTAKRRDLAVLLAHDDSAALTDQFLKVQAVLSALQATVAMNAPTTAEEPAPTPSPAQPNAVPPKAQPAGLRGPAGPARR